MCLSVYGDTSDLSNDPSNLRNVWRSWSSAKRRTWRRFDSDYLLNPNLWSSWFKASVAQGSSGTPAVMVVSPRHRDVGAKQQRWWPPLSADPDCDSCTQFRLSKQWTVWIRPYTHCLNCPCQRVSMQSLDHMNHKSFWLRAKLNVSESPYVSMGTGVYMQAAWTCGGVHT